MLQRTLDEDEIFHTPVVEAYPELQKSYLQHIATPMDFRTIEEERLWYYQSITELQLDLILVFNNCMEFNDTDSPLYHSAKYVCSFVSHHSHVLYLRRLILLSVVTFRICSSKTSL
jgi:Bromodomain